MKFKERIARLLQEYDTSYFSGVQNFATQRHMDDFIPNC